MSILQLNMLVTSEMRQIHFITLSVDLVTFERFEK